mgnify:CR=1 FL=1
MDVDVIEVHTTEVVDVSQVVTSTVLIEETHPAVIEVDTTQTVIVADVQTQFIEVEVGIPGPPGPIGPAAGESMPYTKRTDFVGNNIVYKGEAAPGTVENASGWRISRITFVGEDIEELWAEGTADFNKIWSSRMSYIYS